MILIASNSRDIKTTGPVADIVRVAGKHEVLHFNADDVASGHVAAGLTLQADGTLIFSYNGQHFGVNEIKAAWLRRPNVFGPGLPNTTRRIYLDKQRQQTLDSLWYVVPSERWLNAPANLEGAQDDKIYQLRLAQSLGFAIPRSVISNTWAQAYDSFTTEQVIVKQPSATFYNGKDAHFIPSTVVSPARRKTLTGSLPFPGIWQPYIPKAREWRITIVGKTAFPVAIYTTAKAQQDWRAHQFNPKDVRFVAEQPPAHLITRCKRMLKHMNVRYGAFDIIESTDGTFTFLEVNLNGQYQWLVDTLHLPIPEAIAAELTAIADH